MNQQYNLNDSLISLLVFVALIGGYGLSFVDHTIAHYIFSPLLFIFYGIFVRSRTRISVPNNRKAYFLLSQNATHRLGNYFILVPILTSVIFYIVKFIDIFISLRIVQPITIFEIIFLIFITLRFSLTDAEVIIHNKSTLY